MHMSLQVADVRAFMEDESFLLDPRLDYSSVSGLSSEVIETHNDCELLYPIRLLHFQFFSDLYNDIGGCKKDGGHDTYYSRDHITQSRETNLGTQWAKPRIINILNMSASPRGSGILLYFRLIEHIVT